MSNYFRDRPPRFSDRLRGKTSKEILEELKDQLDKEREMFFESSPGFNFGCSRSSSAFGGRSGFPFSDFPRRSSSRSAFDDLANQHPMFARMRHPDWVQDMEEEEDGPHFGSLGRGNFPSSVFRNRRCSGGSAMSGASEEESHSGTESQSQDSNSSGASGASSGSSGGGESIPIKVTHEFSKPQEDSIKECDPVLSRSRKLPQYATRNTTELPHREEEPEDVSSRNQRAWSEPPHSAPLPEKPQPKRFISKIHITPINPASADSSSQATSSTISTPAPSSPSNKPPVTPRPQSPHSPRQHQKSPFEQIQQTPLSTSDFQKQTSPSQFQEASSPQSSQQAQGNIRHIPIFFEGKKLPPKTPAESYSPQAYQQSEQPRPQQYINPQPASENAFDSSTVEAEPTEPTEPWSDPAINKVETIQKDVEELMGKVESFNGQRGDKEFKFLDEMLTRNMIKLDNVDAVGRDDVRQVRRQAIKSIQRCISLLESKAGQDKEEDTEELRTEETDEQKENKVNATQIPENENEHIACERANDEMKMEVQDHSVTLDTECEDNKVSVIKPVEDRKEPADKDSENNIVHENVCENESGNSSKVETNEGSKEMEEIGEENISRNNTVENNQESVESENILESDQQRT